MLSDPLIAAESLPLAHVPADQAAAAARTVARRAHDKEDLVLLLDLLGLPAGEDDITQLLLLLPDPTNHPHPTQQGDTTTMSKLNAHQVMAIAMHRDGDNTEKISQATGLTPDDVTALLAEQGETGQSSDDAPTLSLPVPAADVEDLLAWAEAHHTKSVKNRAARVRDDLGRLHDQRATERAVAAAEADVEKLEAELARAKEALRQAKNGTRTPAETGDKPDLQAALARPSREELRQIREWARANGHQVADRGLPSRTVLEAYRAAHAGEYAKAS